MTNSKAAQVAVALVEAWAAKDVEQAIEYLTEDIEVVAPNGTFHGHTGYHEFMDGFVQMVTGVAELTAYGDDTTALVWYDTLLTPIPKLTAGERVTLRDDKVARIEIAFDQMPLAQAFGGQAPAHDSTSA
jgi:hypothetical protein